VLLLRAQRPLKVPEIIDGLQRGGREVGGDTSDKQKANIAAVLTRYKDYFQPVEKGSGLWTVKDSDAPKTVTAPVASTYYQVKPYVSLSSQITKHVREILRESPGLTKSEINSRLAARGLDITPAKLVNLLSHSKDFVNVQRGVNHFIWFLNDSPQTNVPADRLIDIDNNHAREDNELRSANANEASENTVIGMPTVNTM